MIRIAQGRELKMERTFITPNGKLTTPEAYFGKTHLVSRRDNPTTGKREEGENQKETTQ